MTNRYYGIAMGGNMASAVTEASSTTSKDIELAVAFDATGMDKKTTILAVQAIIDYIEQDTWPPT